MFLNILHYPVWSLVILLAFGVTGFISIIFILNKRIEKDKENQKERTEKNQTEHSSFAESSEKINEKLNILIKDSSRNTAELREMKFLLKLMKNKTSLKTKLYEAKDSIYYILEDKVDAKFRNTFDNVIDKIASFYTELREHSNEIGQKDLKKIIIVLSEILFVSNLFSTEEVHFLIKEAQKILIKFNKEKQPENNAGIIAEKFREFISLAYNIYCGNPEKRTENKEEDAAFNRVNSSSEINGDKNIGIKDATVGNDIIINVNK